MLIFSMIGIYPAPRNDEEMARPSQKKIFAMPLFYPIIILPKLAPPQPIDSAFGHSRSKNKKDSLENSSD